MQAAAVAAAPGISSDDVFPVRSAPRWWLTRPEELRVSKQGEVQTGSNLSMQRRLEVGVREERAECESAMKSSTSECEESSAHLVREPPMYLLSIV